MSSHPRFHFLIPSALLALLSPFLCAEEPAVSQPARWLEQMDANKDGKLEKDETSGLMKRFFDRNDANGNGVLEQAELEALAKRLAQRNGPGNRRPQGRRPAGPGDEQVRSQLPEGVVAELGVSYREGESKAWTLDLFRPEAKSDAPRPGIVFVHGGGWRNGDKRSGTFLRGAIEYAQKGYVCITVNYRLVDEAPLPACIEDVKCAVRWFRANAETHGLDPERIGAFGNSAGAHLVCMLGLADKEAGLEGDGPHQDQSSLVQAVCASATPTDFGLMGGDPERWLRPGGLFSGAEDEAGAKALARKASPVTYVRKEAPPILLFHGTKDGTVNVKHSDTFVKALEAAGASDVTYLRIEGAGHGVFGQHKARTGPAMEKFFARTLKGS